MATRGSTLGVRPCGFQQGRFSQVGAKLGCGFEPQDPVVAVA